MSKIYINSDNYNEPIRFDVTVRLLDTKNYNGANVEAEQIIYGSGVSDYNGKPFAINLNIMDDIKKQIGSIYEDLKNIDCDIRIDNTDDDHIKIYQSLFFFQTNPSLQEYKYPNSYDEFLGDVTKGQTASILTMEEYAYDYDPLLDFEYVRFVYPKSASLFRNGEENKILLAYINNSTNSNIFRDEEFITPLYYTIYNSATNEELIEGQLKIDARQYEKFLPPEVIEKYKFEVKNIITNDKFTLYQNHNIASPINDSTFYTFDTRPKSQTFDYENPLFDHCKIYGLKPEIAHNPQQSYSILGSDWSSGILINLREQQITNQNILKRPISFILNEYFIDITILDQNNNFVKADRLYPDTTLYHKLNANKEIIESKNQPYPYLKLYDSSGNAISLPSNSLKIEPAYPEQYHPIITPKTAFYLEKHPAGYSIIIEASAKGVLSNFVYQDQERIFRSRADIKVSNGNHTIRENFRRAGDKHFIKHPGRTKQFNMIFNTDKSVETLFEVLRTDGRFIMSTYHGNMSTKPVFDIKDFLIFSPSSLYILSKNRGRKYHQTHSVILN